MIGGGIAGLTCARELARRGMSVLLAERGTLGNGASRAAAGMLSPVVEARIEERSVLELGVEAAAYYAEFVRELETESGMSVDYRREGTLFVAVDRDQGELLEHLFEEQRDLGLPVEWLTGYECRQMEPYLAPGIPAGISSPQDYQVDNRKLLAALVLACRHLGVDLRQDLGPVRAARGVEGTFEVEWDGGGIVADRVVVATGAYGGALDELLPGFGRLLRPVKGQILRVDQSKMPLVSRVVRTPEVYLAPKSNGWLVVGGSSEDRGFDPEITVGEIFEILRSAWECVPGIYELPIRETTVGFRPASIDHAPIIGATGVEGLCLALGYYRHGILFAPYIARLIARLMIDGEQSGWLGTFSPRRLYEPDSERRAD